MELFIDLKFAMGPNLKYQGVKSMDLSLELLIHCLLEGFVYERKV